MDTHWLCMWVGEENDVPRIDQPTQKLGCLDSLTQQQLQTTTSITQPDLFISLLPNSSYTMIFIDKGSHNVGKGMGVYSGGTLSMMVCGSCDGNKSSNGEKRAFKRPWMHPEIKRKEMITTKGDRMEHFIKS